MSKGNVQYAEEPSRQINTQKPCAVQDRAPCVCAVKICAIKKLPPQPVYNMEVETYHNFAVNGGLIVHNCIDAVRYGTESIWRKPGQQLPDKYHSVFLR